MCEQLQPQVLECPLPDPADEVRLGVRRDSVDDRRGQERDNDQSSVPTSWRRIPWSIATFASGAGASARRSPATARRTSPPPATGTAPAARRARAACARGPRSRAGARAELESGQRRSQARHLATSSGLRVMNTWSGIPFSTISRYSSDRCSSSSWCPVGDQASVPPAPRSGRRARSSTAGGRSRTSSGRPAAPRSARLISCSVEASTEEVASSRIRIRGSARIARAIAIRWRCPPDSVNPRSPTRVS